MNTTPTKKKYFIVSLPRTGTKSLCNMVNTLGFKFKHVPSVMLPRILNEGEIEVFADTPIYTPSTFSSLVRDENHYFIYIDRDIESWVNSLEHVNLHNNYTELHEGRIAENGVNKLDRACLEEIFDNQDYSTEWAKRRFIWHYDQVKKVIPSDRLLTYRFDMGWEPLATFMGVDAPDAEVPQINKNTMFDPIV